jgi:hypothetical protein
VRTVLYTHDMEPITVLELSEWAAAFLTKHGTVRLAVMAPVQYTMPDPEELLSLKDYSVRIDAEWFVRRGERHMFMFTYDEENAMLLKSVFLPGQLGELRDRERAAMAKGFLRAIAMLGRE